MYINPSLEYHHILASVYQGISVANPVVTPSPVSSSLLVATQSIPFGVSLEQASIVGGSFQVAYTQAVARAIGMPSAAISALAAAKGRRLLSGVIMTYIVDTAYSAQINIVNGNLGAPSGTPVGAPSSSPPSAVKVRVLHLHDSPKPTPTLTDPTLP